MKDFAEVRKDKRITIRETGKDGMSGWVTLKGKMFGFIASNGGGWDHVSASLRDRTPTWDEMCAIKDIFFGEGECCVEYHPAKRDYVNMHQHCLHIWKPQNVELPKPPMIYV